ncbi:hypothetical protein TrVE_jg2804 [Triparma verrucosa]|uniref:Uncharacterized protein n=1 Tax=Triparma verrucosa TaxID=1606542 RepID=A0A9W7ER39_9STRA|nr:hypothetical protein TrVE_jg2804 [Triparma verrucosa]
MTPIASRHNSHPTYTTNPEIEAVPTITTTPQQPAVSPTQPPLPPPYLLHHVAAMCEALAAQYGQTQKETCPPELLEIPQLRNPGPQSKITPSECGQPPSIPSIDIDVFAAVQKLSNITPKEVVDALEHHKIWLVGDSIVN